MQQELEHKQREEEDALYRKFLQVSLQVSDGHVIYFDMCKVNSGIVIFGIYLA
jgi:hypothetical protein